MTPLPRTSTLRSSANCGGSGIENGLHQWLEVTAQENRSRVRQGNAVRVRGMFRRLGISLFMHWRAQNPKRLRASLRDFHGTMHLNHQRHAFNLAAAAKPLPFLSESGLVSRRGAAKKCLPTKRVDI